MAKATRNIGNFSEVKIVETEIYKTENLPFPYVHYPHQYGIFFGFSKNRESPVYFCECNIPILQNYIEFNEKMHSMDFPPEFFSKNSNKSLKNLDLFRFEKKLCHRCNLSTPSLRYCHDMYGSKFKQFHGWYINQTYLRLGIKFYRGTFNEYNDYCPEEVKVLIEKHKDLLSLRQPLAIEYKNLFDESLRSKVSNESESQLLWGKIVPIDKELGKNRREIDKYVENVCRTEFGYRKVGETWVSETQLFNIIRKIFPKETLIRHYRPNWLEHLELDIFIPELKIAFEYQGQQHYYPIKTWGGEKAFIELQKRDKFKKELCMKNLIRLIEINYTEPLTEEFVKWKIENKNEPC